jgi:hypothetical protein
LENRWIFTKTDETNPVQFYRFTENRPVEFEIFKNLRNFEIKIPKKTILHLKNFGQNKIQKYVAFRPRKIEKGAAGVKIEKIISTGSF